MRSTIVSPLTGRTLSQRMVADGDAIGSSIHARVDSSGGPVTVLAPATIWPPGDADACFVVEDVGGQAADNPITIGGNGRTIDGAASFALAVSGGVALFLLDDADGEWKRAIVPRVSPTSEQTIYLTSELPATPAAAAAALTLSPVDWAASYVPSYVSSTLNECAGLQYRIVRDHVCTGMRVLHFDTVPRRVQCGVFGGISSLATATNNAVPGKTPTEILFAAPVTLSSIASATFGAPYDFMVWVDDGANGSPRPPYFGRPTDLPGRVISSNPYPQIFVGPAAYLAGTRWRSGPGLGAPTGTLYTDLVAVEPIWTLA